MNRPAKVTQGEIARAIRAARAAGGDFFVEIAPNGKISLEPLSSLPMRNDFSPVQIEAENWDNDGKRRGSIYVAIFERWVKIGFSTDVPGRVGTLQAGLPDKLTLVRQFAGDLDDEKRLLLQFSEYRARGEWFENRGRLKEWVDAGCPT